MRISTFLLGVSLLLQAGVAGACSCVFIDNFCQSVGGPDTVWVELIIRGRIERVEDEGVQVQVQDLLHGNLSNTSVWIASGNGADCVAGTGHLERGAEYLMALFYSERYQSLVIGECGTNVLPISRGVVRGKVSPRDSDVPYDRLADALRCVSLRPGPAITFEIYPNPTSGRLHILPTGDLDIKPSIALFNSLGQAVPVVAGLSNGITRGTVLDMRHLPSGVYFLRLHALGEQRTVRIIKSEE